MSRTAKHDPTRCGSCGAAIAPRATNPTYPFCGERCRLIDLGRWLDGDYKVAALDDGPSADDDPSAGDDSG